MVTSPTCGARLQGIADGCGDGVEIAVLLANAARYCLPGDEVSVVVRVDEHQAMLSVVDSGPGIADDELPHVFDRLWRGRAAQNAAGSGIGLAVAREIVAAHGGTIGVARSEGGGATITIRLPLSPEPALVS